MLTGEQFRALKIGDMIEHGVLFEGITEEPLVWMVEDVLNHGTPEHEVFFHLTYFGISLDPVAAVIEHGVVVLQ